MPYDSNLKPAKATISLRFKTKGRKQGRLISCHFTIIADKDPTPPLLLSESVLACGISLCFHAAALLKAQGEGLYSIIAN